MNPEPQHPLAPSAAAVYSANALSIPDLRAAFAGQVIAPGDAEYDAARAAFYGGFDRRPAVILRPRDAAGVAAGVALAHRLGLELSVRSGGHSPAGYCVSHGGVMLDLRELRALEIDPAARTAWAGAGLTAGEYTRAADDYGLATGFGDTGSVGIGGITLGGGIGYLVRKYGMTIDSLLAAEVVTANGEILHVDEFNHPDLFWALRGGGGNFGVATRFKFRLHPTGEIYGGLLLLPARPDVIERFIAAAGAAPDELSTILNVMPGMPMPFIPPELHGKLVAMAVMVYAGDPQAGRLATDPFRELAEPIADLLKPMRYPEIFFGEDGEEDYHPTVAGLTMFMDGFDRPAAQAVVDYLSASDAPMRVAQLRVLGGAMGRVTADATAFAHRQKRIMAGIYAFYNGIEEKPRRLAWARELAAALERGEPGAYVNFLADEGPERVRAAYPGDTWERLQAVKARYDPHNLFRLNQNIPPQE